MSALRRRLAAALLAASASAPAAAGEGDGFSFLEVPVEARLAGLGGSGVSLDGGAAAFSLNPAALGGAGRNEASLSYFRNVEDSAVGELCLARPLRSGSLGFRVLTQDHGGLTGYDAQGDKTSSFAAKDSLLSAGYGRPWGASGRWGISAGHVRSSIAGASAETVEGAAGVSFAAAQAGVFSRLRAGAALRHVGAGAAYEREKAPLPRTLALGASWTTPSESWTATADLERPRAGGARVLVGQELWLSRAMALRAGWRSEQGAAGAVTVGAGFAHRDLSVDYAFASGQGAFQDVHRLGISWRWGGRAEALYQEALRLMRADNAAEAAMTLKKLLDLDPRHRRGLALLHRAAERMKVQEPAP